MVVIKSVDTKSINDSRKQKTIQVIIKTNVGVFSASSPSGKSKGKHEAKPYKKDIETDIKITKQFSDYFSNEFIESFDDLKRVEDIIKSHVGANTLFALESAVLKAMAKEQKKQIWELINPKSKKFPRLVGNCIGGGLHSNTQKKPDFQEFLLIPEKKFPKQSFEVNKGAKEKAKIFLKKADKDFNDRKNDENAWITKLNEKEVLEVLKKLKIPMGLDIAASSFYGRKKYHYQNPMLKRDADEQFAYISNLIKNFNLYYIEDPFSEEDFENFAKLLKKHPRTLIVGDDLTVTSTQRLKKAIEKKSINAIIIKPNQTGSLLEVKKVNELAKKNNIKTIFSHRSGETQESILSDIAFGFEADFLKVGITGKEREVKINRLIEIEKGFKK
jgi:enolase